MCSDHVEVVRLDWDRRKHVLDECDPPPLALALGELDASIPSRNNAAAVVTTILLDRYPRTGGLPTATARLRLDGPSDASSAIRRCERISAGQCSGERLPRKRPRADFKTTSPVAAVVVESAVIVRAS